MKTNPAIRLIARGALAIMDPVLRHRLRQVVELERQYRSASAFVREAVKPHLAQLRKDLLEVTRHRNQLRQMAGLPTIEPTRHDCN